MLNRFHLALLALFLSATLAVVRDAVACPELNSNVDFNCDEQLRLVVIGDSIVRGRGDTINEDNGGWVKRLATAWGEGTLTQNLGTPGISSGRLLAKVKQAFARPRNSMHRKMLNADIFVVAVGVNDYFEDRDPALTVRNVSRIVKLVRKELDRGESTAPYVVVAKLTPTTREFQKPFVEEVNRALARFRSNALPSYLRFDLMSEELVSFDGLHPVPEGYDELEIIAADFFRDYGTPAMRALRPDRDVDGIYDKFERAKFGTNSKKQDSDGDDLTDGAEVFTYHTDPGEIDTDGDGLSDSKEIDAGTDPLRVDN